MASGRYPSHFLSVEGLLLNTYAIALNGNVICDLKSDETVWINTIEHDIVEAVLRFLMDGREDWKELHYYSVANGQIYSRVGAEDISEFMNKVNGTLATKLIVTQYPKIECQIREALECEFPMLSFTQSWPAGLEMNTLSGGKGNAVKKLREMLGGREVIHTVVCVGDYENDISMIEYADIGYAVENAIDSVKAAADRITVSNREHAIARIIAELDKEFS